MTAVVDTYVCNGPIVRREYKGPLSRHKLAVDFDAKFRRNQAERGKGDKKDRPGRTSKPLQSTSELADQC